MLCQIWTAAKEYTSFAQTVQDYKHTLELDLLIVYKPSRIPLFKIGETVGMVEERPGAINSCLPRGIMGERGGEEDVWDVLSEFIKPYGKQLSMNHFSKYQDVCFAKIKANLATTA